jgi:hypothetical protein
MYKLIQVFFILISVCCSHLQAQPFVDIATFQHITLKNSSATSNKTNAVAEGSWDFAASNIPWKIDSSNLLVVSPSFEYRSVVNDVTISDAFYRTAYLPVTYVRTFKNRKNRLSLTGIYRFNADTRLKFGSNNDQAGALALFYHQHSARLTYKVGIYYNQEFFRDQWIPFLGVDYHINDRLMLFCLLPRYLILDYTLIPSLHSGFWFRGIDESYRYRTNGPNDYFRVTEGYLRWYIDYYIPNTLLVASMALGHTAQRNYSYEIDGEIYKTFPEGTLMFQAGIALRFVVDPLFKTQRKP